jgi:hypothetical protein
MKLKQEIEKLKGMKIDACWDEHGRLSLSNRCTSSENFAVIQEVGEDCFRIEFHSVPLNTSPSVNKRIIPFTSLGLIRE